MGYGVYEEGNRWAGYMVPAECDLPECHEEIDRGMYYKCEEHITYPGDTDDEYEDDEEVMEEGCGLFLCDKHLDSSSLHVRADVVPKPDTLEWKHWQLVHDSWKQWRTENSELVKQYQLEFLNAPEAEQRRIVEIHEDEINMETA